MFSDNANGRQKRRKAATGFLFHFLVFVFVFAADFLLKQQSFYYSYFYNKQMLDGSS